MNKIAPAAKEVWYVPLPEEQAAIQSAEEPDPMLSRYRAKRQRNRTKTALIAVGIGAAILTIVAAGAIAFGGKARVAIAGPSAAIEGQNWTHKELGIYLDKKIGDIVLAPGYFQSIFGGPSAYLTDREGYNLAVHEQKKSEKYYVFVMLCKSSTEAKEMHGVTPFNSFAWGRFFFRSDNKPLLLKFKNALGA